MEARSDLRDGATSRTRWRLSARVDAPERRASSRHRTPRSMVDTIADDPCCEGKDVYVILQGTLSVAERSGPFPG